MEGNPNDWNIRLWDCHVGGIIFGEIKWRQKTTDTDWVKREGLYKGMKEWNALIMSMISIEHIYKTIVKSIVLYGAEVWQITKLTKQTLKTTKINFC